MNIKNNVGRFCLKDDASIIDAMRVINEGEERICFLVDSQQRLSMVITDGDIRRAFGHQQIFMKVPACIYFPVRNDPAIENNHEYENQIDKNKILFVFSDKMSEIHDFSLE